MFTPISGCSFNQLALNTYETVLDGRVQPSRNGDITCVNNAVLNLTKPQNRHLYLEGRKSNIIAQMAETFWVMAGDDRVNPFLSFYLPRAADYSDDGHCWRGAYGPRLYIHNQLQEALEVFTTDGLTTRQSVVQILLPELDAKENLLSGTITGDKIEKTKDRPCNNELVFFCVPNEDGTYSLNLNVFQRSGDAIWGALNINVFEWTFLMELFVNNLNAQHEETIVLGEYTHFVTNLHIYDKTASQAKAVVQNAQEGILPGGWVNNDGKLIATGDVDSDRRFFMELVKQLSKLIDDGESVDDLATCTFYEENIEEVFSDFGIPIEDNLLWEYALAVLYHTLHKKGASKENITGGVEPEFNPNHKDFDDCLRHSSFFKLI